MKLQQEVKDFLKEYWEKKINKKYVYRTMPKYLSKSSLNPKKSLFNKRLLNKFERLWSIIKDLDEKGFRIKRSFEYPKHHEVSEVNMIGKTRDDLKVKAIDFTSNLEEARKLKESIKGGAAVNTIKFETNTLIKAYEENEIKLMDNQLSLIKELNDWSISKAASKMVIIGIKASNKCLNESRFISLIPKGIKEKAMIVGDHNYFKNRVIEELSSNVELSNVKRLLKKYDPFFVKDSIFHVSVIKKIPKKMIKIIET